VLVMVTWVAGVFIKTSVFYYCAAMGMAQVFGLSAYRPVVLPLGVIMATFSIMLFQDVTELSGFLAEVWPRYGISLYFLGLPLILLIVSLIREKVFGTDFKESEKT